MSHTFHIPVLGLGYSIDTPLRVARYGISSVVSIVDDDLIERMRELIAEMHKEPYQLIKKNELNCRALRITAYLNLLDKLVAEQVSAMKFQSFEDKGDLCKYFELLPENDKLAVEYRAMLEIPAGCKKSRVQANLKGKIMPGKISVNIMSKVDKANYKDGIYLGDENTDALAALRGFAESTINGSVVISAGLNPKLFSYMASFPVFNPLPTGRFYKSIVLKVSDYRSALIQAKVLAKKGLWVSEFRIESGLNCGGHAFATEGFLLGPILQEFKDKRSELYDELYQLYQQGLMAADSIVVCPPKLVQKVTVQGGIGTAEEHDFLMEFYQLDAAGWGSPFLLVPEATSVDPQTLKDLTEAVESDYYISDASPLGVRFNNFRKNTADKLRLERIALGRPGSPCTKKYLCNNTEFTAEPICTASREYQHLKLKQLHASALPQEELDSSILAVTEKLCLCEGLCASAYQANGILKPKENKAVSICPGPNLAYFNNKYTLREMVDHIYGRINLLQGVSRPNLFIKELSLYLEYLRQEISANLNEKTAQLEGWKERLAEINGKKVKYFERFCDQLNSGLNYYRELFTTADPALSMWSSEQLQKLEQVSSSLNSLYPTEILAV
ncbi:hypothetical protein ACXZ1K_12410 [Pedobacter sp. PWIIR3]